MNSESLAWKIRRHAVEMVHRSGASHIASALSAADILAVLYADVLRVDPRRPDWPERDRFVMSKGHAGAALYAALAECGFFPVAELDRYYQDGSVYSGHVSHKGIPGVEVSTGSLGHGVGMACGMALAGHSSERPFRVFALAGDGECDEGIVWEAALAAGHCHLDNFTLIVDRNGMQAMGPSETVMALEPLGEKWRSFGWEVLDVADGHDHQQLRRAFAAPSHGRPRCILAHTVKGKGISFMENELLWHYRDPQGEFYDRAVAELEAQRI